MSVLLLQEPVGAAGGRVGLGWGPPGVLLAWDVVVMGLGAQALP